MASQHLEPEILGFLTTEQAILQVMSCWSPIQPAIKEVYGGLRISLKKQP